MSQGIEEWKYGHAINLPREYMKGIVLFSSGIILHHNYVGLFLVCKTSETLKNHSIKSTISKKKKETSYAHIN